jgi:hypothetical protein
MDLPFYLVTENRDGREVAIDAEVVKLEDI